LGGPAHTALPLFCHIFGYLDHDQPNWQAFFLAKNDSYVTHLPDKFRQYS
jgi:hypothetical protein